MFVFLIYHYFLLQLILGGIRGVSPHSAGSKIGWHERGMVEVEVKLLTSWKTGSRVSREESGREIYPSRSHPQGLFLPDLTS